MKFKEIFKSFALLVLKAVITLSLVIPTMLTCVYLDLSIHNAFLMGWIMGTISYTFVTAIDKADSNLNRNSG